MRVEISSEISEDLSSIFQLEYDFIEKFNRDENK